MRAVIFDRPDGDPASIAIRDIDTPVPGPGQVLLRNAFAGLNYADLMMRSGIYPHPKGYPLVAGLEMSGYVAAVGLGVTDLVVGNRVAAFSEDAGAFAEYCIVPVERVLRLPDAVSLETGAAFYVQALTAWHLLHTVSATRPGDTVLIHAIGGGVGLQLVQLAKAAGAMVIGTVGTLGKQERALEYGADAVVLRNEQDFVEAALAMTGGRGVDKVVDSTGATILDRSFDAIRPLGHVVSYGEAEGKPLPNLWERLMQKSLTFTRLHVGHLDYTSDVWRDGARTVLDGIAEGSQIIPIEGCYSLDTVNEMFAALASRQMSGKLIMRIAAK